LIGFDHNKNRTEAAKRKELSQATHIARIRWMTAFRVLVTTLKDAVSAQKPSSAG
jgi:hypothetical protein